MVDVLKVTPSGVEIYEVKSSTKVKKINLQDVAFQYYVLSQQGYEIKKDFVVHINSRYVREEVLEVDKLFYLTDVLDEVVSFQDEIPNRDVFEEVLCLRCGLLPTGLVFLLSFKFPTNYHFNKL